MSTLMDQITLAFSASLSAPVLVLFSSPGAAASSAAAGLGLGIALAGAPGPVQAILLTESIRGGTARGFRAQAGANITLAALLVGLAFGLSLAAPGGTALRIIKLVGGVFLLLLAADGFRGQIVESSGTGPPERRGLPPAVRGPWPFS